MRHQIAILTQTYNHGNNQYCSKQHFDELNVHCQLSPPKTQYSSVITAGIKETSLDAPISSSHKLRKPSLFSQLQYCESLHIVACH